MAPKETPADAPAKQSRLAQIRGAYTMTRKADPKVGWVTGGVFAAVFLVLLGIGFAVGHPIYAGIVGFMLALLAATVIFGRRAEKAAFSQVDGQPGAAAAALNMLRKGWTVTLFHARTPAGSESPPKPLIRRSIEADSMVM